MHGHRRASIAVSQTGFTLIELLVVMSVIALMLGLLLPVLGSARDSAKLMKCASNLRQIGTSLYTYAMDHKDELPQSMPDSGFVPTAFYVPAVGYNMRPDMVDYLSELSVWSCPSTEAATLDDAGNSRPQGCYGTYAYMPGRGEFPNFGLTGGVPSTINTALNTSELTFVQDEYRDDDGGPQIYNHGLGSPDSLGGNSAYAGYRGELADGINVVFFDGHAAWHSTGDLNVVGMADSDGRRQFGVLPTP